MKNKGFTLTELIVTIVIVAITGLSITVLFLSEYRFRTVMQDRIALSREAAIAMDHLTRVLRFAKPTTIIVTVRDDTQVYRIVARIEYGHLPFILLVRSGGERIRYRRYAPGQWATLDNVLQIEYLERLDEKGKTRKDNIANNITSFRPSWDSDKKEFTIDLTAGEESQAISLHTKIRVLGE